MKNDDMLCVRVEKEVDPSLHMALRVYRKSRHNVSDTCFELWQITSDDTCMFMSERWWRSMCPPPPPHLHLKSLWPYYLLVLLVAIGMEPEERVNVAHLDTGEFGRVRLSLATPQEIVSQ